MNCIAQTIFVLLSMNMALVNMDTEKFGGQFGKEDEIIIGGEFETCDAACKKKNKFCYFDAYPNFTRSDIEKLVLKQTNLSGHILPLCNNTDVDWPFPYLLNVGDCIHHFESNAWRTTPACKVAAPIDNVKLICFCRRKYEYVFNKTNRLVLSNVGENCNDACSKIDRECDFEKYAGFSQDEVAKLLYQTLMSASIEATVYRDNCYDHVAKFDTNSYFTRDEKIKAETARNPPMFNEDDTCISGYVRVGRTTVPDCAMSERRTEKRQMRRFCSCTIRNEFDKTNKLFLGKIGKNCHDACSEMECNFEKYSALSQDEVVELLDETLRSASITSGSTCDEKGTTSHFTSNTDFTNETDKHPPAYNEKNKCISGYVRSGKNKMPDCAMLMDEKDGTKIHRFCSCTTRTTTPARVTTTVQTTTFITTTKPVMKTSTIIHENDVTTNYVFLNSAKYHSSLPPSLNSTADAAEQARINKKYVAAAVTKMYILAAVMVIVEVILLGFLIREIRRNRALDKKEEEERKLREAERRRNSKAKTPKRPKKYSRNQRPRRS